MADNVGMKDDILRAMQRVRDDVVIEVPDGEPLAPGRNYIRNMNATRQRPQYMYDSGHDTPDALLQGRLNTGRQTGWSSPSSGSSCYHSDSDLRDRDLVNVTDLAKMSTINTQSILDVLSARFKNRQYYTDVGDVLIAMNPCSHPDSLPIYDKKHHEMYDSKYRGSPTDPHIYRLAERCYSRMCSHRINQAILISGESGSGKTCSTQHIVKHIAHLSTSAGTEQQRLHQKIVQVNPLIEVFGNARTPLNANSSRFAKYVKLLFSEQGTLMGAEISDYMLEKSRLVQQNIGEKNFKVVYFFMASVTDNKYGLLTPEHYRIVQDHRGMVFPTTEAHTQCANAYKSQIEIMKTIGFSSEDITLIEQILASIFHITNLDFEQAADEVCVIEDNDELEYVSELLKVDKEELEDLFKWHLIYDQQNPNEPIQSYKTITQAEDTRDAIAKTLYHRLFGWIIQKVNAYLNPHNISSRTSHSIGILDMAGFEDLPRNGLEQLFINIANERLQYFFNDQLFSQEENTSRDGGVNFNRSKYKNNDALMSLFVGHKRGPGMLKILDDCTQLPQFTDTDLVSQWKENLCDNPHYHELRTTRHLGCGVSHSFNKYKTQVRYDVENMIELNRDSLDTMTELCFANSHNENIQDMFKETSHRTGTYSRSSGVDAIRYSQRRTNKTLAQSFKHSLAEMMKELHGSECFFVRCIKPNADDNLSKFDTDIVENQLRYSEILGLAKIRKMAFPVKMSFSEFVRRYGTLYVSVSPQHCVSGVLRKVRITDAELGNNQVFLKDHHCDKLDMNMAKLKKAVRTVEKYRIKVLARRRWLAVYGALKERARLSNEKNGNNADTEEGGIDTSWDFPRTIPWERPDTSESFQTYLRGIKIMFYMFLFISMLFLLVANKLSLLTMTSKIRQNVNFVNAKQDAKDNGRRSEVVNAKEMRMAATSIIICMTIPHVLNVFIGILKAYFGGQDWPSKIAFIWILVIECFHTIGTCVLVFLVLPNLDMIRGLLIMSCVAVLPGLLKLIFAECPHLAKKTLNSDGKTISTNDVKPEDLVENPYNSLISGCWYMFNAMAVAAQIATIIYVMLGSSFELTKSWHTVDDTRLYIRQLESDPQAFSNMWQIPLALIFVSLRYWENFVDKNVQLFGGKIVLPLQTMKEDMHQFRQKMTFVTSTFSIAIIIAFPFVALEDFKFDMYSTKTTANILPPLMQGLSGLVCYILGLTACMLRMQMFSFNLPLLLATPITLAVILCHCMLNISFLNDFKFVCPEGLDSFHSPEKDHWDLSIDGNSSYYQIGCLIVSWIAFMVICGYMWKPRQNVLDPSEKLFVTPMYCGILFEQSMLLNRRRKDKEARYSSNGFHWYKGKYYLNNSHWAKADPDYEAGGVMGKKTEEEKVVPLIHACATLWHETPNEMEQLLKSVFRLDRHQNIRRNQQEFVGFEDPNYYELQVHMFFDDAMTDDKNGERVPNSYVHDFMRAVNFAGNSILECNLKIPDPLRTPTPYGGRLTWTLPGGTKMYVHMKDKQKIRHRKRWSQVMYMYYLLGYQLITLSDDAVWGVVDGEGEIKDLRKDTENRENFFYSRSSFFKCLPPEVVLKAENTFLLALDGDVDFKPNALRLLMDLMKKNKNVGAACGRIHPIGSSPIVWYQMFEYAIAHWLQKAAEHVFGCVLCSPGCFSLFRGSAIMDDNVMKSYTKKSEKALDYVQYDQGEDRWLCTLLLQAGYKVEYSAAADALTYCPERFDEFYNQRRRWTPSTMANIVDLIGSFTHTVEKNNNISNVYMIYQILLFASSLIAPGTILLSVAGSFRVILQTSFVSSYVLAIEPAVFYVFICMTCKQKTQLTVAALMSAGYAIIMTVTIIGTLVAYLMGDALNPNLLFLCCLVGFFLIAALLHPQEMGCLLPAPLFFLCVPSGYLLLTIYSLCNLNIVTWGTRESLDIKTPEQKKKDEEEAMRNAAKKKKKGIMNWLGINNVLHDMRDFFGSFHASPRQPAEPSENTKLLRQMCDELTHMNKSRSVAPVRQPTIPPKHPTVSEPVRKPQAILQRPQPLKPVRDDMVNPKWLEVDTVGSGYQQPLSPKEATFWRKFIDMYLLPIDADKVKEEKTTRELAELRTFVVMGFSIINFLWIITTFLLQYLGEDDAIRERLYIPLGSGDKKERLEPFGLFFLFFFSLVLVLQFFASVVHRLGTLLHLLAVTDLSGAGTNLESVFKLIEETYDLNDVDDTSSAYMDSHAPIDDVEPLIQSARRPSRHHMIRMMTDQMSRAQNKKSALTARRKSIAGKARGPQMVLADHQLLTKQFRRMMGKKKSMLPHNRSIGKRARQERYTEEDRRSLMDTLPRLRGQRGTLYNRDDRHRRDRSGDHHVHYYGPNSHNARRQRNQQEYNRNYNYQEDQYSDYQPY